MLVLRSLGLPATARLVTVLRQAVPSHSAGVEASPWKFLQNLGCGHAEVCLRRVGCSYTLPGVSFRRGSPRHVTGRQVSTGFFRDLRFHGAKDMMASFLSASQAYYLVGSISVVEPIYCIPQRTYSASWLPGNTRVSNRLGSFRVAHVPYQQASAAQSKFTCEGFSIGLDWSIRLGRFA